MSSGRSNKGLDILSHILKLIQTQTCKEHFRDKDRNFKVFKLTLIAGNISLAGIFIILAFLSIIM